MDHISRIQVLGAILLLIGIALRYWINRRWFNRRTPYGTTAYKSYEHKVFSIWENFVKIGGGIIMLAGLFLIVLGWLDKH